MMDHPPKSKLEGTRKNFPSRLETAAGSHESISIKLDKEGKPKIVVFEDIDKTLLHLESVYPEIRSAMWPEAVAKEGLEEFTLVHLAGFRLGTMWRELYRLHGIYDLGKEEWRNPEVYERDFLAHGKEGEHIDEAGDPLHELADEMLRKFDDIAATTVERVASEDPKSFDEAKIQATYKLNKLYKKLGVPVVGMSANPRKFIEAVCKYTGLSEVFLDCATDTDVPGAKEHKMKWLADRLEESGIKVPYDKLLVIGDSPLGDVGSASRFQALVKDAHPEVKAEGIVIIEGDKDQEVAIQKLSGINDIDVHTFDYFKVPVDEKGQPKLNSKSRSGFYQKIK